MLLGVQTKRYINQRLKDLLLVKSSGFEFWGRMYWVVILLYSAICEGRISVTMSVLSRW